MRARRDGRGSKKNGVRITKEPSVPVVQREGVNQKVKKPNSVEELIALQSELLKDMLIANLAIAGIGQRQIAKVARVDLNRVNRIAKLLKRNEKRNTSEKRND
jgi:hypothetical protein